LQREKPKKLDFQVYPGFAANRLPSTQSCSKN
jgi:hypothetical protein